MKSDIPFGRLLDDPELLHMMISDSERQLGIYRAGPYWADKAKTSAWNLNRFGLANFRGDSNMAGLSFTDNLFVDLRNTLSSRAARLIRALLMTWPLRSVFDAQVSWTKSYARQGLVYQQQILQQSVKVRSLLSRYVVPPTMLGDCQQAVELNGIFYAFHYLELLSQHDELAARISFPRLRTVFEIGGGFGVNVHLLLANYPNIRKVLYLDIPPNLYVGTQYLRAFFGDAVSDYRALRQLSSIGFSSDDRLEILCIAPWQVESFGDSIDILLNAHSFVEMPRDVVANYATHTQRIATDGAAIALTSYDRSDPKTTIDPRDLPEFFSGRSFERWEACPLLDNTRVNYFFASPSKFTA